MRALKYKWWLWLLAVFCAVVPAWADAQKCVKTVRWELEPPYGVRLDDGRFGGYYAELAQEALRRMGCETRFVEMTWAGGLRALQLGELDIVAGALKTSERGSYARFSQPINFSPNALFLTKRSVQSQRVTRVSDVIGTSLLIGVEAGVLYGDEYMRLQKEPLFRARIRVVPDRQSGWRMLASGQLDGLLADEVTGVIESSTLLPPNTLLRSVRLGGAKPSHLALSRSQVDEAFVASLDTVITGMVADGTLANIRRRYIPCELDVRTRGCVRASTGLPDPR